MKKYAKGILYIWLIFQIVLATGIVFSIFFLHNDAPGIHIVLTDQEIGALNPKAIDTINAMGILLNGLVAIFLSVLLFKIGKITKKDFVKEIALPLLLLQFVGFLSDTAFGNINLGLNILSSFILLIGLILAIRVARA